MLEARYLRRDENDHVVESAGQLFMRVADAVAEAELVLPGPRERRQWAERFRAAMSRLDFLPNSPTLMNAGTAAGQLSACFVLPVQDSLESIAEALRLMILVQRTGGGTGFSFSHLRPRGARVASSSGAASGPVGFMKIFDCATEQIRLGGRRRGANMGVLRVDHPDILDFVNAKLDRHLLRNFNLSVAVTDAFMEAAANGKRYPLVDPRDGRRVRQLSARGVMRAIAEAAWETGDPGFLFIDAVNRGNPAPQLGAIEATNPCGEVPLLPYESCNLGSVNLAHVLKGTRRVAVDWQRLAGTVRLAVRFLDDVIEINRLPAPELERATRLTRKIGLGIMGFAELLIRLGIPYDSERATKLADRIMRFVAREARAASESLAAERGVFPCWGQSRYATRGLRLRNATLTAIAPTGTISIVAGTTPGIEPLFALRSRRHVLEGAILEELAPTIEAHAKSLGLGAPNLAEAIERGRSGAGTRPLRQTLRSIFRTALEIPPRRHLDVQAAFQRHVDNSVSKTINLPETTTVSEIESIYRQAWALGLKGITVYRYGSRPDQVIEIGIDRRQRTAEFMMPCARAACVS